MAAFKTLSGAVKILRSIGACRNGRTNLVNHLYMGERKLYFKGRRFGLHWKPGVKRPWCQLLIIFKMADAVPSR